MSDKGPSTPPRGFLTEAYFERKFGQVSERIASLESKQEAHRELTASQVRYQAERDAAQNLKLESFGTQLLELDDRLRAAEKRQSKLWGWILAAAATGTGGGALIERLIGG